MGIEVVLAQMVVEGPESLHGVGWMFGPLICLGFEDSVRFEVGAEVGLVRLKLWIGALARSLVPVLQAR